jgi:di/tricarboxylate transporter
MIALQGGAAEVAVFAVLGLALVLFVAGTWRHDVVALLAAMSLAVLGLIPADRLFAGFGHPAVITVAGVLVVSRGLQNSGLVELLASWLQRVGKRVTLQVGALSGVVGTASAFMNNVGAVALFLPVAVRLARRSGVSPSVLLMPIAFASLLGGMITLIGTPPNIIIATFRADVAGAPFAMFDFAPVGLGLTLVGVLFITLLGWRLLPDRGGGDGGDDLFGIQDYLAEVRVTDDSSMVARALGELSESTEGEVTVVALVRDERSIPAPPPHRRLRAGDLLLLRADSEALQDLTAGDGLELVSEGSLDREALRSEEVELLEAVVRPDSPIVGRTVRALPYRLRREVNLLAIARRGARLSGRLAEVSFRPGDVLLLQSREAEVQEILEGLGALPLAERALSVGRPRRVALGVVLFGGALALTTAGILPVAAAFVLAALGMVVTGLVPTREIYTSVDWPVIVLLAAMLPVGEALDASGGAARIAGLITSAGEMFPAWVGLALILVGTMFLSDLMNNAASVVLMAPIAITVAGQTGASADPFLMAVAVGGSCAFLTPIGHQSNILVMAPAGYRFGDYWKMGLPLELLIVMVGVPLILVFWPL